MGTIRSKPPVLRRLALSVTGALPNSKHSVKFSDLERELNGFPFAVHAVEIRVTPTYNALASAMATACPGLRAYGAIGNVNIGLSSTGHKFVRDVGGLGLRHDSIRVLGFEYDSSYSAIADADATGATTSRTIHIPFAHRANVAGAEDDGCVPLAVFRDSDFQINVGSAAAFGFTGITMTSCSFEVWLVLKPMHKVLMPTAWEVRMVPDSVRVLKDVGSGFWQYLDLVDFDNSPDTSLTGVYGKLKLVIENAVFDSRAVSDFVSEQNYFTRKKQVGYATQNPGAPTYIPLVPNQFDMISRQPRGMVKVEIESRQTEESYMISRTNGFRDGKFVYEFLRLLGANPADFTSPASGARLEIQSARSGKTGGASEVLWPSLPAAVVWPDNPFSGLREGAAFKS